MKKVLLIAFLSFSVLATKAQQDSGFIARKVIESFQKGDINILKKLVAPPKVYKQIYPEVKRKTNKQIINETINSKEFKASFDKILAKAKAKNINLDSVQYIRTELTGPEIKTLRVLNVHFAINGKKDYFGIFCHYINNNWYFSDFTNDDSVF
jgi:hypothetical protein